MWKWVVVIAMLARPVQAGETRSTPPVSVVVPARFPDDLPGPPAEHARDTYGVALPAVPDFALPASEPGLRAPGELRGRGKPGGEAIRVKGYVTWIYDCAAELARSNPKASSAEIGEAIAREPALCEAPMFALGDLPTSRDYVAIEVADVPRHGARLAVGDHVIVTGAWATASPGGEQNPAGLLVYRAIEAAPNAPPQLVAAATGLPDVEVTTAVPLRPIVETAIRNASVSHLNACSRAVLAKQYDVAIAECTAATDGWPDNHLAWYHLATARLAKLQWPEMAAAIDHAVALRPDQAMYQLYAGMARHGDPGARDALLRAVKLDPELWRAHYYLGKSLLDGEPRRAAEQLGETIRLHPSYTLAYLALVELYLRWGYVDAAIAVATLGTTAAEPKHLWLALALAHRAHHDDAAMMAALDHALAARADAAGLLLRAQLYLRNHDARARADLERVAASTDPAAAREQLIARRLLAQLASRREADRPRFKQVSRPSEGTYHPWSLEDQKYRF